MTDTACISLYRISKIFCSPLLLWSLSHVSLGAFQAYGNCKLFD